MAPPATPPLPPRKAQALTIPELCPACAGERANSASRGAQGTTLRGSGHGRPISPLLTTFLGLPCCNAPWLALLQRREWRTFIHRIDQEYTMSRLHDPTPTSALPELEDVRMRRSVDRSGERERLLLRRFCRACIIAIRGYDFQEGRACLFVFLQVVADRLNPSSDLPDL
jgi:hypothetical protein